MLTPFENDEQTSTMHVSVGQFTPGSSDPVADLTSIYDDLVNRVSVDLFRGAPRLALV